ncbi:unnamed protein product [Auanema sp. JU1783]|nr:unnamed protein product [Auanema sp. JU1783]
MTKYISNPENLKLMMELLREKGRSIQFEAFHVFKIFLANPDLPSELGDILLRNPEDLADYLQTFFQGSAGDLWPLEQLELCVDLIRLLPDDYSDTLEICEQDVMKAVSKILKTPPHRIDQRYKLAALGLAEAFTTKRGPLWFENDCQLLCLVAYLASAELRIILDNPGEISFNSLIICVDLLEMAIRAVDDEDFINDEDSLRISRAVQDASAFIVSHWVGAQEIETEKEKISQEVSELFYRYLCTLFSYGGEIFLQPEDIKKVTPLLVRIFHQFCVEKDIIMASALVKVLHAVKYDEKTALLLCDFLSITDPSEPDNSVINETIISIANLSVRCDWYDTETLSILKTRALLFTTEEKLHEVIKRI